MPGKIKVKILAGRNLPVMDRSGDTTDAYVEIKFGNTTYKTDVCRKSLNPQWNSEWYRFEVDDAELQDEPLQIRLMDHDTYSANDAIGKVYVNLNPLLLPGSPLAVKNIWTLEATMNSSSGSQGGSLMTGWIPVFDTMHGIRGEVNIIVKVELFSDCNKFRQSSCGVQFFYSPNIPRGYHAQIIHGFVEELVVSDDPEYKWIDKIRTPRASNEARQTLFFKLSGEVQRKIGLKALDLGGNAVIGYVQNFDLEGESGIVARGIGTAVTLVKLQDISSIFPMESSNIEDLTCFGLQSKNPLDYYESDENVPLLSHSPNQSPAPLSPINLRATSVSQRFPKYERPTTKHSRQSTRIAEYRAVGMRSRQLSLQNSPITNGPMRKGTGSSLSLVDDLISETSLKNMLALEDMRGEPVGNPFSRGLKNIRYLHQNILPKRVAQIKSKIADSFDDESDPDSSYSSTWSLAGSESNRSSIADLRHSIRRKKFTHKKANNDGIAALLIRSVHSGFPLDSVIEDRETPAPSPVNFLPNSAEYDDERTRLRSDNEQVEISKVDAAASIIDYENRSEKKILAGKKKRNVKYGADRLIPMISSSETDTSTSDDDDEDEPSESSTNYNILDETYSPMDLSSLDEKKIEPSFERFERTKASELLDHPPMGTLDLARSKSDVESFGASEEIEIVRPERSLESSTDYNILDDTSSLIDPTGLTEDGNFDNVIERPLEVTEIPSSASESSQSLDKIEISLAKKSDALELELKDEANFSSASLADGHSECSTDYHFLDDTTSLIDSLSFPDDRDFSNVSTLALPSAKYQMLEGREYKKKIDDSSSEANFYEFEKYQPSFASNIEEPKVSELVNGAEPMLSSTIKQIDNTLVNIGHVEIETVGEINDSRCSVFHENVNSSTEYNIIEDRYSQQLQANSLDNETFAPIQAADNVEQPIVSTRSEVTDKLLANRQDAEETTSIENLESSTDHDILDDTRSFEASDAIKIESRIGKDFDASFSSTDEIYSDKEEQILARSSSAEPSHSMRSAKLKHLKFLLKQDHFDNAEETDFVTSTPVETEVDIFPDVAQNDQSVTCKPLQFNKKYDTPPISPSKKTKTNVFKMESTDMLERRDICPLGVPIGKTTIVNETKTEAEIPATLAEISPTDRRRSPLSISKKDKAQKRVERTDTVIYRGPPKERDKFPALLANREPVGKTGRKSQSVRTTSSIPIIVAPPPEDHATRLQVPVIRTTNINVQSTFSPDEMKIQRFGSVGSRKLFIEPESVINDKFNRKYRLHCIQDLIKTIDAKMMTHHGHHERRDSTKSKQRKKRERMNASATPSPDSIHRTRQHRRRSKSRSPERHVHSRGQVSPLSTHSFPIKTASISNLVQEPPPSCDSSYENIPRNSNSGPPVARAKVEATLPVSKENTISLGPDVNHDRSNNPPFLVAELTSECVNVPPDSLVITKINDLEIEDTICGAVAKTITSRQLPLGSKDLEHPVFKSHSAGSLDHLTERPFHTANTTNTPNTIDDMCVPCSQLTHRQQDEQPSSPVPPSSALPSSLGSKVAPNNTSSAPKTAAPNMHRRSSDSDLSITPKGNSLAGSDRSMGAHLRPSTAIVRTMNQDTMEMLEYPFITMQQYPPGFVLNIGGLVSARSVKLLERITNLEEPEGRDAWWTEIRMEVRSHARALACNVVLGYKEEISICDDVCVLNASGTAAVINLLNASQDQDTVMLSRTIMTTSVESERDKAQVKSTNAKNEKSDENTLPGQQTHSSSGKLKRTSESNDHEIPYLPTLSACSLCHLPYSEASVPFRVDVSKCSICRRAKVPDVLFTTIELPENIPMTGRGVFLQATVCKCKRDLRGELNAKEISDCLPFLEYELHSLLLNKLKVKGMNAIFGLKVQVSVGERLVIGMAVGTAVYLTALPPPSVPQIASGNSWHNEEQLAEIQKTLIETVKKNREFYRLKPIADIENGRSITTSDTDESDDDLPDLDLGIGTKDACVLEVDDVEDMDRINLLIDEKPPDDFHVVNTESIPGLEDLEIVRNLQMFTQISRAKIPAGQFASMPSKYFARMLQTVLFKLRRMVPCALCDMQFKVALPEPDEIQLSVVGMALGLGEPTRFSKYKRKLIPNSVSKDPVKKLDDSDLIFSLDEDQVESMNGHQESVTNQSNSNITTSSPVTGTSVQKHRPRSPFRTRLHMQHRHKHVPLKERYGVDITPLSYLPGGKIERYLGNLNFFFIRESTSIRENGGLSGFTHSFVTEILAIVRAHITAIGGNAMVAFFMTQCVLLHSPHKNQGQCLINVGGDVVTVSYYGDDKYSGNHNC